VFIMSLTSISQNGGAQCLPVYLPRVYIVHIVHAIEVRCQNGLAKMGIRILRIFIKVNVNKCKIVISYVLRIVLEWVNCFNKLVGLVIIIGSLILLITPNTLLDHSDT
jgi:uncharacterized membrane protein